jgi:hypothetical protein
MEILRMKNSHSYAMTSPKSFLPKGMVRPMKQQYIEIENTQLRTYVEVNHLLLVNRTSEDSQMSR